MGKKAGRKRKRDRKLEENTVSKHYGTGREGGFRVEGDRSGPVDKLQSTSKFVF